MGEKPISHVLTICLLIKKPFVYVLTKCLWGEKSILQALIKCLLIKKPIIQVLTILSLIKSPIFAVSILFITTCLYLFPVRSLTNVVIFLSEQKNVGSKYLAPLNSRKKPKPRWIISHVFPSLFFLPHRPHPMLELFSPPYPSASSGTSRRKENTTSKNKKSESKKKAAANLIATALCISR